MSIIPYGKQYIDEDDKEAVLEVLGSDYLTQGPAVLDFEKQFAMKFLSSYAASCSSATAGLHLAVKALGLKPGQKVVTTPNTFLASANSVLYSGGKVEFADIDPATFNIDVGHIEKLLKGGEANEFAGIIPVHFAGKPAAMKAIKEVADKYGVWVIEDACHAPGARYMSGELVGSCAYSDATVFSFHPVKHIAAGEGGMVTTNNDEVKRRIQLLRTHGVSRDLDPSQLEASPWYYEMTELGYNYRLTDIQAALGNSQLKKLDSSVGRRNEIASRYRRDLVDLPISFQGNSEGELHAYHLFVILAQERGRLYKFLRDKGILCQVHYIPIHHQPFYKDLNTWVLPLVDKYYERCLSLPMYPTLSDHNLGFVIDSIREFYE